MRRTAFFLVPVLIILLATAGFAARGSLGGTWDFIVKGSGEYDGVKYEIRQTGRLVLVSDSSKDPEILKSFSIDYEGYAKFDGQEHDYSGSHKNVKLGDYPVPYKQELEIEDFLLIDDEEVEILYRIAQESENKVSGKAIFSVDGEVVAEVNAVANRVTGDSSSGCNVLGINPFFVLALVPLFFKVRK
ncbi:MAG: SYNERG-CTERM sorting domain-containing protein [Synergistaceae bacterium]|jgi:Synergist-CTERM protein sorting domain-containing protein|nr:SYNERG-CTERM sorting domain-containing protein [Synergistaceae bacterium]